MATAKAIVSGGTAMTITLASLANGNYVASNAESLTTPDPLDVFVEVAITPGTVAGNKRALLFVQASLDGTNYSTGPTSGTTTTDEPNLYPLGVLPLNTSATLQRKQFSMLDALGFIPAAFKLVVFNDSGAAFNATGGNHAASYYTVVGDVA